jgi:hypothetical protein
MYVDIMASGGLLLTGIFLWYMNRSLIYCKDNHIKMICLIGFLLYGMSWQYFTSSIGAFILGAIHGNERELSVGKNNYSRENNENLFLPT